MYADTLQHIFAVRDQLDNEPPLIHMLESCTDCEINASDALPKNICENCVLAVKSAYQFKLKSEESQKYFKDLLGRTDCKPDINELTTGSWCVTDSAIGEVHLKSDVDQTLEVQFKAESDDSLENSGERTVENSWCVPESIIGEVHLKSDVGQTLEVQLKAESDDSDSSENSGESIVERKCYPNRQSNHIKRSIRCAICCRWFPTERGYRLHKRTHGEELPHSGYRHHKLTHSEELPYRCTSCPLRFWTIQKLRKHLMTHMGERLHKCPHCPKAFTHLCLLKKHSYAHNEDRPFQCPYCPKTFKRNHDVTKHSIVHTGLKLYQCSECNKSFGRIYDLRVHADHLHSSKQVYMCSKCRKTFAKSNMLSQHVKFCTETG
ncbi:zinc finger protein 62 homolog [Drosophila sulfurigaster albostrigata]|uniref:zinc finger protein 62 homolog n=1 Tax=Drosophila sulfurigaster albostrigata TaxID=89887 RepID=UPI002D21C627|nr:zinc finger protein 62 homolog [Drosophila sulfurigaster albostrigata]